MFSHTCNDRLIAGSVNNMSAYWRICHYLSIRRIKTNPGFQEGYRGTPKQLQVQDPSINGRHIAGFSLILQKRALVLQDLKWYVIQLHHLTMRFDFVELTYYLSYGKNYNLIIGKMPTVKGIVGPYRFFFYSFDCEEPMLYMYSEKKWYVNSGLTQFHWAKTMGFHLRR